MLTITTAATTAMRSTSDRAWLGRDAGGQPGAGSDPEKPAAKRPIARPAKIQPTVSE